MNSLIDGVPAAAIPLDDRGLRYGDGLFETCVLRDGRVELWPQHLQRLTQGCERLGIPAPDTRLLDQDLAVLTDGVGHGLIKLSVTRGSGGRGYKPPKPATPRRLLALFPPPDPPAQFARDGIPLYRCRTRLGDNPLLAGIKHLNRLEQVLARAEWDDPAIPEGLVCDQRGRPHEGTMSNLFAVVGNTLVTPDLSRAGVAGVMRDLVLELAESMGIPVQVRALDASELADADEVFVTNSVIRLWPVVAIGDTGYCVGPLARGLQSAVADALACS